MYLIIMLLIVTSLQFSASPTYSCTAFYASQGDVALVGNNEDYHRSRSKVWFVPGNGRTLGRVYLGRDDFLTQGGMNEAGLFFDCFATKPLDVTKSGRKPRFKGNLLDKLMAECVTVGEALTVMAEYNLEDLKKFQVLIADRFGDSAIVEGDEVIRKTGWYQVVTNFRHSKVDPEKLPCERTMAGCDRYRRTVERLEACPEISVDCFRKTLEATKQWWPNSRTQYSNICELRKGLVHLYYKGDFSRSVTIDLAAELALGSHVYDVSSLFSRNPWGKKRPSGFRDEDLLTYLHESPAFRISYPKTYERQTPVDPDEVFRAGNRLHGIPIITVSVAPIPAGVPLTEIGERGCAPLLMRQGTNVAVTVSRSTKLADDSPAQEVKLNWIAQHRTSVSTLVLSTYREGKWIYVTIHSVADPDFLIDLARSLEFS